MTTKSVSEGTIFDLRKRYATIVPDQKADFCMQAHICDLEKLVEQEVERRKEQDTLINRQLRSHALSSI